MNKDKQVKFRVTDKYYEHIESKAKEFGTTVSKMIRAIVEESLGHKQDILPPKEDLCPKQEDIAQIKEEDVQGSVFTFKCIGCGDRYTKQNPHHLCPPCNNKKFPKVKE